MTKQIAPKVNFVWNEETEVDRVLNTAATTARGFFSQKGFLVLPETKRTMGVVVLPSIPYQSIPHFWEAVKQNDSEHTSPLVPTVSNEIRELLRTYLLPLISIDKKILITTEKKWRSIEKKFFKDFFTLFPQFAGMLDSIEIRLTRWGTGASWSYLDATKKGQHMIIYLRNTHRMDQIAWVLISAFAGTVETELHMVWEARQSISDFLMSSSLLSRHFPEFSPTMPCLHSNDEKLQKQSADFLESIGVHVMRPFNKKHSTIYLFDKPIDHELSESQEKILSLMITNQNHTVDYDTLASTLWESEDEFSLWAINKQMQRLTKKIVTLGGHEYMIEPVRGRGYVLNNVSVL